MAGRLLAQHPRAARQVIMVTDGEPTAHLEGEQAFFAWPPEPETIRLTLATDGVIGANGGPRSPGTAYILLHHTMGGVNGQQVSAALVTATVDNPGRA